MKEMVILNKKEQRRLVVLNQVEVGKTTGREASEVLDFSLRHTRRLLAAYRKEDAQDYFLMLHHIVDSCGIPIALYIMMGTAYLSAPKESQHRWKSSLRSQVDSHLPF
jgi:hypothetical protein